MHKAGLLLIFVLSISAMIWGFRDLEEARGDHFFCAVGLAKLAAGALLATLALGFRGLVEAICEQEDRPIRPPSLPGWLRGGWK